MAVTAEKALELVRGAHERQRLAHAFLVSGPAGSGKRELAARIVQLVNPPGSGGQGRLLDGGNEEEDEAPELDAMQGEFVRIVRPRSKSRRIRIAEIRELERSMHLSAPSGVWKIGVIVDADRMFDEPANAFLKTLEEPPPQCLLLLLTAHSEVLLPTIRSRCIELVLHADGRPELLAPAEQAGFAGILAEGAGKPSERVAMMLKSGFEQLLAERKASIEAGHQAALKEEAETYRRATEGDWLEEREKFYAALSASEYLAVRAALVDWLVDWLGDAVRQKVGVKRLGFPEYSEQTARFAGALEIDALLGRIDALQELRDLLETNVPEGLALEVSFLRAFGG